ncbi:MAG: hypothetical protein KJZ87_09425 [Thermoguttaceae bacterium]|nr:hypothetical protein [Thermoguttaceae bacterium]
MLAGPEAKHLFVLRLRNAMNAPVPRTWQLFQLVPEFTDALRPAALSAQDRRQNAPDKKPRDRACLEEMPATHAALLAKQ